MNGGLPFFFEGRIILPRDAGPLPLGDGDLIVTLPNHTTRALSMRSGWPLFPITCPEGEAPASFVIYMLEARSPSHASNVYRALRAYALFRHGEGVRVFRWRDEDEGTFLRYYAHLRSQQRPYEFAYMRRFYTWAASHEYEGFDPWIARNLKDIRVPNAPRGVAVRTRDPRQGALSAGAVRALVRYVKEENGPLFPRICVSLGLQLGANVAQFGHLRVSDLLVFETGHVTIYHLALPRSKKRDGYQQRKRRPIDEHLGQLLQAYIEETTAERAALGMDDPWLLLSPNGGPLTGTAFNDALRAFATSAHAIPGLESLTERRLRRTLATRLVEQGASRAAVMEVLDHSDGQSVGVYFEQRPDATDRIDAAVAPTMGAIVGRFQGTLVAAEGDAHFGDRPEQRIKASIETGDVGVGTCERDVRAKGLCPLFPPLSCYTCPLFQPWADADHHGFARSLEKTRDEIIAHDPDATHGPVVGQYNDMIAAIEEVADLCAHPPSTKAPEKRHRRGSKSKTGEQDVL